MTHEVRRKVIAGTDGVIAVHLPELPAGTVVEVVVLVEGLPTTTIVPVLAQMLGAAKGSFATRAEADEFIRKERAGSPSSDGAFPSGEGVGG